MNTKHYLLLIEPRYLPLYFCGLIPQMVSATLCQWVVMHMFKC